LRKLWVAAALAKKEGLIELGGKRKTDASGGRKKLDRFAGIIG